ncbi:hypothetical protein GPECTOR_44g91 [Gonium pectorale]|uniref:Uncharacterized protein n=1 Tax=Gonium pectorale TaxID=33097 RepID=A0A150G9A9_GONPE|nr:hypothetical protein GPECTOR_44g91 [Gonium pectorale]|eukprot:KXZ46418.1 hypothetical protein GPECTOR_44g91 [Gonium pectorale]
MPAFSLLAPGGSGHSAGPLDAAGLRNYLSTASAYSGGNAFSSHGSNAATRSVAPGPEGASALPPAQGSGGDAATAISSSGLCVSPWGAGGGGGAAAGAAPGADAEAEGPDQILPMGLHGLFSSTHGSCIGLPTQLVRESREEEEGEDDTEQTKGPAAGSGVHGWGEEASEAAPAADRAWGPRTDAAPVLLESPEATLYGTLLSMYRKVASLGGGADGADGDRPESQAAAAAAISPRRGLAAAGGVSGGGATATADGTGDVVGAGDDAASLPPLDCYLDAVAVALEPATGAGAVPGARSGAGPRESLVTSHDARDATERRANVRARLILSPAAVAGIADLQTMAALGGGRSGSGQGFRANGSRGDDGARESAADSAVGLGCGAVPRLEQLRVRVVVAGLRGSGGADSEVGGGGGDGGDDSLPATAAATAAAAAATEATAACGGVASDQLVSLEPLVPLMVADNASPLHAAPPAPSICVWSGPESWEASPEAAASRAAALQLEFEAPYGLVAESGIFGVYVHVLMPPADTPAGERPSTVGPDRASASDGGGAPASGGSSRPGASAARVLASLPLLLTTDPRVAAELNAAYDEHASAIFYESGATDEDMQPHLPYSLSRLAAFRDHVADLAADLADLAAGPPPPPTPLPLPLPHTPPASPVTLPAVLQPSVGRPDAEGGAAALAYGGGGPSAVQWATVLTSPSVALGDARAQSAMVAEAILRYLLGRGMVASARLVVAALRQRWGMAVAGEEVLVAAAGPEEQEREEELPGRRSDAQRMMYTVLNAGGAAQSADGGSRPEGDRAAASGDESTLEVQRIGTTARSRGYGSGDEVDGGETARASMQPGTRDAAVAYRPGGTAPHTALAAVPIALFLAALAALTALLALPEAYSRHRTAISLFLYGISSCLDMILLYRVLVSCRATRIIDTITINSCF